MNAGSSQKITCDRRENNANGQAHFGNCFKIINPRNRGFRYHSSLLGAKITHPIGFTLQYDGFWVEKNPKKFRVL